MSLRELHDGPASEPRTKRLATTLAAVRSYSSFSASTLAIEAHERGSLLDDSSSNPVKSSRPTGFSTPTGVSAVDARMLGFPSVSSRDSFTIKGAAFDLDARLQDHALPAAFEGGTVCVFRLYLSDYHHFHFPDGGTPGRPWAIPGRYYAVTPYSRTHAVPYFAMNHRVLTRLESDSFGMIVMVEIGAFTVGSIRESFEPDKRVTKGDHKGNFALGGSVVVLLFELQGIDLDDYLVANSCAGAETYVHVGESIGKVPARA